MADHPDGYGLVMPFVCVTSKGGPYDDAAFVAGARYGQDAAAIEAAGVEWDGYVYPEMVPQYDLLAMHHGFTMHAEPWAEHPDEWVWVTFTRAPADGNP